MQTELSKQFKRTLLMATILGGLSSTLQAETIIGKDINSNIGPNETINALYSANQGKSDDDQSLQFGDTLYGTENDDVIIGGLGIDILWGNDGDDILIGGTEDFNAFNRDRAFGGDGQDIFIWAPGDGNDVFYGGEDTDVLILGLIGENKNSANETSDAPYFAVSNDGNFDGIFLDDDGLPQINFETSPGFCEIVERDEANGDALTALKIDHLVRFIIRSQRTNFIESQNTETPLSDDGLRIAVQLKDVEYLVCSGAEAGTRQVFDLTVIPAQEVDVSQLPLKVQTLIGDTL